MPLLIALSLYGGVFAGYCLGDTQVIKGLFAPNTMEQMAKESQRYIAEEIRITK